jgi:hypothetical protein
MAGTVHIILNLKPSTRAAACSDCAAQPFPHPQPVLAPISSLSPNSSSLAHANATFARKTLRDNESELLTHDMPYQQQPIESQPFPTLACLLARDGSRRRGSHDNRDARISRKLEMSSFHPCPWRLLKPLLCDGSMLRTAIITRHLHSTHKQWQSRQGRLSPVPVFRLRRLLLLSCTIILPATARHS